MKLGKLLELVNTYASFHSTHTRTNVSTAQKEVPPRCDPSLFRHSLVKDGQVQCLETVVQSDITLALEQCGAEHLEEACMGSPFSLLIGLMLQIQGTNYLIQVCEAVVYQRAYIFDIILALLMILNERRGCKVHIKETTALTLRH